MRFVTSTEKLVVEIQSMLHRLCDIGGWEIYFSYAHVHIGVLGNDRADQLAKEATDFDIVLLASVLLTHFKHLA